MEYTYFSKRVLHDCAHLNDFDVNLLQIQIYRCTATT